MTFRSSWLALALLPSLAIPAAEASEKKTLRGDHVAISYEGISEDYAQAIARVVNAARAVAAEKYGFDVPDVIEVKIDADKGKGTRLFNDGVHSLFLTVGSEADLRKPASSGTFVIYGLCHEVGHLAMYRLVTDHRWMTTAAAEGWAHYLGSRLVDDVFTREGPDLWPDRYAYDEDGMKRLTKQMANTGVNETVRGAKLWQDFVGIVGDKGARAVFASWGKATIDPGDPAKSVATTLSDERLRAWWASAGSAFTVKRPASQFTAKTAKPAELGGKPLELARDDGMATGKKSLAGGGHAVHFQAPGEGWYLTSVQIHGARYGAAQAPKEDFRVYLCDDQFQRIATFKFPYGSFKRGESEWVTLSVAPTNVPAKFMIGVDFNPAAQKGVYVSHDGGADGSSVTGLPGSKGRKFEAGDWMIRVKVEQLRSADALRPE